MVNKICLLQAAKSEEAPVDEKARLLQENAEDFLTGVMADSHGRPETIAAAIDYLRSEGCRRLFHLGDICDSNRPETVEACIQQLTENDVLAVKGNNDHNFLVNRVSRTEDPTPLPVRRYLESLPLRLECEGVVYTHSLPFQREFGLACMVRDMGEPEARYFFRRMPETILFRGHSHLPEMIWQRGGALKRAAISVGNDIELLRYRPCIVTVGSLTRGYCAIWRPEDSVFCLRSLR